MADKTCKFFVQFEPVFSPFPYPDGTPKVLSIKAVRLTQKRPGQTTASGTVVVEMKASVPEQAFHPLRPTATVVVQMDNVDTRVEVLALEHNNEEEA